ncbi:hypothetical protein M409DRAFT_70479 [Zasmidium cellare ATCC 36951]|uniref:Peroxisomal-coenzyme A synthetase n=1 Tax=Zasmidium cellare ATCC 36951 TaxID=1080233 RepID=A0A6A6C001_ZASCE|nr:uncharacterized protein M409DRAFT_70479 [Zasmidium cellare ATCC 36951]KAF2160295.1 hypothetical protein M409DRAFT_70479 [Zasmidium cellare ATCC 36951]
MTTLANSFSSTSNAVAIVVPGPPKLEITYKQLQADIKTFQHKLAKLGISPGAAVSIALPNSYPFIVAFLAASWQRGIAAPLNSAYKQSEFEFYIDDLSSALVLVPQGQSDGPAVKAARRYNAAVAECYLHPQTHEVVLDVKDAGKLAGKGNVRVEEAQPEDTALVLHTSGTTGRPKAVPLSHRNLTRTIHNIINTYQLTPADRTMLVMPLFHVHGLLAGFLAPLGSGGSVIVPGAFSASTFWTHFTEHGANWYTAVPTMHQILLVNKNLWPQPMPNIRFIRSCSSPLSPKVFHELEKAFHAPVLEAYAMTEAAHQMTSNPLPPAKRKPGSVGIGQGVEVKILDQAGNEVAQGSEAEICIRGPNVTKGYINNDKANAESFTAGGFFRTGDQGKKDEDGYVIITGRIKELINKGGEKISPIELDNVLVQHPSIAEAVSFAIPDELYGQDVGVAVVPKKDGKSVKEEDVKEYMREKVAKFKVPKRVFFTDVMPKTATGKIQRRMVADAMLKSDAPKAKL